jgi:phosphoribosyl-AMP cyclohydrolase
MTKEWAVKAQPTLLDDALFNEQGLIPVIAQDSGTKKVLMLAWMDHEALRRTLRDGRVTYYSRSRKEYWRKGDSSGNTQTATHAQLDCDGDVVLLQVHQHGPVCHTGTTTCFDGSVS